MKRLILQTYINDGKDRKTIFTYKPFPKMKRLSRNQFKKYASSTVQITSTTLLTQERLTGYVWKCLTVQSMMKSCT